MILSNTSILEALDDGRLRITPEPSPRPGTEDSPFGTTSVDLTLSSNILVPSSDLAIQIDLRLGDVRRTIQRLSIPHHADSNVGWLLARNVFALGQTVEEIWLPVPSEFGAAAAGKPGLAARVEGKSSLARFGLLVHFTAPTIHAGFRGPIALEIMNLGPAPIVLYEGMQICQLIIEQVDGVPAPRQSQFHGQTSPSGLR